MKEADVLMIHRDSFYGALKSQDFAALGLRQVFCVNGCFFLAPQAFWAVEKWESCFWISTFPPPTVLLGLRLHFLIY